MHEVMLVLIWPIGEKPIHSRGSASGECPRYVDVLQVWAYILPRLVMHEDILVMTWPKESDSLIHGSLLVVSGPNKHLTHIILDWSCMGLYQCWYDLGVFPLLSRTGWTRNAYHMHIFGWNACAEMTHQRGSWRQPLYDKRNPSMENASLVERECWIFSTSGSHSPQESTIRPIYTITEASRRISILRKRSRPHRKNNNKIEDLEIRSQH